MSNQQANRNRATIEALKIALEQAADMVDRAGRIFVQVESAEAEQIAVWLDDIASCATTDLARVHFADLAKRVRAGEWKMLPVAPDPLADLGVQPVALEVHRWRAMAAPDWAALPVELTGASGDA